jgi:hypothetical protein
MLRTLRKSAEANVAPVKSFPLITPKMFSKVFGNLNIDCQHIGKTQACRVGLSKGNLNYGDTIWPRRSSVNIIELNSNGLF